MADLADLADKIIDFQTRVSISAIKKDECNRVNTCHGCQNSIAEQRSELGFGTCIECARYMARYGNY